MVQLVFLIGSLFMKISPFKNYKKISISDFLFLRLTYPLNQNTRKKRHNKLVYPSKILFPNPAPFHCVIGVSSEQRYFRNF